MTKAGTLARVFHELLKGMPTEAGATLSRGQAETLAGLAEIAAAVMAEARHDEKERAAALAEMGRDNSPVMLQDLEMLCDILTDPENDIDIVNDYGAAYEYDIIATLYRQAQAAGYTDGQAIKLQPVGQSVADYEEAKARTYETLLKRAEARAQAAEAKAADYENRIEWAMCYVEDFCSNPDTGNTECDSKEAAEKALDEIYWHIHL